MQVIANLYLFYPPLLHTPTHPSLDLLVSALDHDNSLPGRFSGKRRNGRIGNFCCIPAIKKRYGQRCPTSSTKVSMFLFRRVTRSPSHALSPPWMLHSWGASDTLWSPLRAPPDSQGGEWHCDRPCQGISPCQGIPPPSASTERRFFQPGAGRGDTVRLKRQGAL